MATLSNLPVAVLEQLALHCYKREIGPADSKDILVEEQPSEPKEHDKEKQDNQAIEDDKKESEEERPNMRTRGQDSAFTDWLREQIKNKRNVAKEGSEGSKEEEKDLVIGSFDERVMGEQETVNDGLFEEILFTLHCSRDYNDTFKMCIKQAVCHVNDEGESNSDRVRKLLGESDEYYKKMETTFPPYYKDAKQSLDTPKKRVFAIVKQCLESISRIQHCERCREEVRPIELEHLLLFVMIMRVRMSVLSLHASK